MRLLNASLIRSQRLTPPFRDEARRESSVEEALIEMFAVDGVGAEQERSTGQPRPGAIDQSKGEYPYVYLNGVV